MDPHLLTRRYFFGKAAAGLGTAALASLLQADESSGAMPGFHTFRRRRSASSICSNPAHRRRWICSTTSRACGISRRRNCRIRSGEDSVSRE